MIMKQNNNNNVKNNKKTHENTIRNKHNKIVINFEKGSGYS